MKVLHTPQQGQGEAPPIREQLKYPFILFHIA